MGHHEPKYRQGFTRLELAVSVLIIILLLSLTLVALYTSREYSRLTRCQNNFRQLGIAFHMFAEADASGRLATGVPNLQEDGCPDQVGWVADVLNNRRVTPTSLICPSNPLQSTEVLGQLMEYEQSQYSIRQPRKRKYENGSRLVAKSQLSPACEQLPESGSPNFPKRADFVKHQFLDTGYATNYAASWYFGRTTVRVEEYKNIYLVNRSPRLRRGSRGPLNLAALDNAFAPASNIPLLGDGAVGRRKLDSAVAEYIDQPSSMARGMNDGPAYWNHFENRMILLEQAGTEKQLVRQPAHVFEYGVNILITQFGETYPGPNDKFVQTVRHSDWQAMWQKTYGGEDEILWLQDTTGWAPVHRGRANILMADGGVKAFRDADGDGYLNPGFPKRDANWHNMSRDQRSRSIASQIDLPPYEIFSGALLSY